jgi:hypothetical protein
VLRRTNPNLHGSYRGLESRIVRNRELSIGAEEDDRTESIVGLDSYFAGVEAVGVVETRTAEVCQLPTTDETVLRDGGDGQSHKKNDQFQRAIELHVSSKFGGRRT